VKAAEISDCGRFIVIDGLHIDRQVFSALAQWADIRGVRVQDAIQLAICAFTEHSNDPLNAEGRAQRPVLAARLRRVD
jgi:hypothetical protein